MIIRSIHHIDFVNKTNYASKDFIISDYWFMKDNGFSIVQLRNASGLKYYKLYMNHINRNHHIEGIIDVESMTQNEASELILDYTIGVKSVYVNISVNNEIRDEVKKITRIKKIDGIKNG